MEITMMLLVKSLVMFYHGLTHIDPFVSDGFKFDETFSLFLRPGCIF